MEMRGTKVLVLLVLVLAVEATTDPEDTQALQEVRKKLVDSSGKLENWVGDDPCGDAWAGVYCGKPDRNQVQHVEELRLLRMGLGGALADEVGALANLKTLDVMWNSIQGGLPASVGNLTLLERLLVSGNNLSGPLPTQLGMLGNLLRLQIDENGFEGGIPVELAQLHSVMHLHMNNNSLSGDIPTGLGVLPNLMHLLLDNNQLGGTLPEDLTNISSLLILQLDNNPLGSQPIPPSYSLFASLTKLSLRNCNLVGVIPDFHKLASLQFLDLSENALTGSLPDLTGLTGVTTVILSDNQLAQNITGVGLASGTLPQLQALLAADNKLNGSANVTALLGGGPNGQAQILDLQNNQLSEFKSTSNNSVTTLVAGNDGICGRQTSSFNECVPQSENKVRQQVIPAPTPDSAPICGKCALLEVPVVVNASDCACVFPVELRLRLKSPGLFIFEPFQQQFLASQATQLNNLSNGILALKVEQVQVLDYAWDAGRLLINLTILPDGGSSQKFSEQQWQSIYTLYANWRLVDPPLFGPYEFLEWIPGAYQSPSPSHSSSLPPGAVAGIVAGAVAAAAAALAAAAVAMRRRKRGGTPLVKVEMGRRRLNSRVQVKGVRGVSMEEVHKATAGFSEERLIGRGGYGKVYRGFLEDGQEVAIKRAQQGSKQGEGEFLNEIELLSRVHHRNLVRLVGYCDEDGEQMLVYEYMAGGSVAGQISGMGLRRRVGVALGAARGIAYLHTEANPPVFHRDIKAANILLDANGVAKVADFGLSKLAPVSMEADGSWPASDSAGVSTMVKGTPGYLDPEYFLTHKLTDKSDVYSFGVLLMEFLTGKTPIWQGMNLMREVRDAYSDTARPQALISFLDASFGPAYLDPTTPAWDFAMAPLLRLAIACAMDRPADRPLMLDVVRQLETIWQTIDQDPDADQLWSASLPRGSSSHHSGSSPFISDTIFSVSGR